MGFFFIVATFAGDATDNGTASVGNVVDAGGAILVPSIE